MGFPSIGNIFVHNLWKINESIESAFLVLVCWVVCVPTICVVLFFGSVN